ncbi:helix-turn-helix domain-containing protein (plasmid) [Streptomyces sp. NBC_01650]|uniref:hypothetical protein n=1 Tax=Streptomyces sp. NBC_01650 TaxID=2975907 RepID=UPI00386BF618|nr:helix-turn-helix domain-containing protein [Streptomyces sp. NBC_01650]
MSVRRKTSATPDDQGAAPRVVRAEGLDWVKFDRGLSRDGTVPTTWKALYAALASFADQDSRETPDGLEDDEDVPTRPRLAECIGKSVDTVDRATAGLEGLGLVEVERRKDPNNPKRNIPSLYRLLDHEIWDERAAERAAKRKAERQAKAEARAAKKTAEAARGGRTDAATPGRTDAARVAAPMRPGWPHPCGGSSSSLEDLSLKNARGACDESEEREREAAAPEPVGADVVVDAYERAAGRQLLNGTRTTLRAQAVELLAAGRPVEWVAARAAEMPANGWTDLIKHCERSRVPLLPGQAAGPGYAPGYTPDGSGGASRVEIEAAKAAILARGSGL